MTWALQRQIIYVGIFLALLFFFGFLLIYPYFNKPPTCFDNRQNADETGVDCGGSCLRACIAQTDKISVLWSRAFRVVPGRYNAVAYLENQNKNLAVQKIRYRFRFADKDNIYIGRVEGETFVPPAGNFAVFEPAIDVGNSIPVYTSFELIETPLWLQVPEEKVSQLKVLATDIVLEDPTGMPKLSATIKNNSLFVIPDLNVITILYDVSHNAVAVSRTYLPNLGGGESRRVNFTWPEPLPKEIVFKEIIPMFDIFSVKLR